MSTNPEIAAPADPLGPVNPLGPVDPDGYVELDSAEKLREMLGEPWPLVIEKVKQFLVPDDRDLLARSPMCFLSTSDAGATATSRRAVTCPVSCTWWTTARLPSPIAPATGGPTT